ncbi:MAG: hypothetical protein HY708_03765 [Ignavibacteriae bacterium]|nr:hypothetical protein [Ignavibacteriota bacterium]
MKHASIVLFLVFLFSSCRTSNNPANSTPPPQSDRGVFIINEGAFPNAGTMSFYNITKDIAFETIISAAEGWLLPNDAKVFGNKVYVVVNGSDRVEVLDAETFQKLGTIVIPTGSGPGYISIVDNTKAIVANYNGTVSLLNLTTRTVTQTTPPVVEFPGSIVVVGNKVFDSDFGPFQNNKDIVIVMDAVTLSVTDTIRVSVAAGSMVAGSNDRLYVVSTGIFPANGKVYAVNTLTNAVVDSVEVGQGPTDITFADQSLYVLLFDRVVKLSTFPLAVADIAFVSLSSGLYFYSTVADPVTGDLYVSKVVSGDGSGVVEVYTPLKSPKRQPFAVGSFPGAWAFK